MATRPNLQVGVHRSRAGKSEIRLRGLAELKARLTPRLYERAVTGVIETATQDLYALARERAPRRTGRVFGSIRKIVDTGHPPRFGRVTANAERDGFRYAWALNAAKRIRFRFRSGPRKGRLTRGWFTGVLRLVRRRMPGYIAAAEQTVRREWFG